MSFTVDMSINSNRFYDFLSRTAYKGAKRFQNFGVIIMQVQNILEENL